MHWGLEPYSSKEVEWDCKLKEGFDTGSLKDYWGDRVGIEPHLKLIWNPRQAERVYLATQPFSWLPGRLQWILETHPKTTLNLGSQKITGESNCVYALQMFMNLAWLTQLTTHVTYSPHPEGELLLHNFVKSLPNNTQIVVSLPHNWWEVRARQGWVLGTIPESPEGHLKVLC